MTENRTNTKLLTLKIWCLLKAKALIQGDSENISAGNFLLHGLFLPSGKDVKVIFSSWEIILHALVSWLVIWMSAPWCNVVNGSQRYIFECRCIELVAYSRMFSLLQGWDLQSSKSPNSMKIVLFADFVSSNPGLSQAQYVLKQLCNEGHQITLFGR